MTQDISAQTILDAYGDRSTKKLRDDCRTGKVNLPDIPKGKESQKFFAGDHVHMSPTSPIKDYLPFFTIKEVYIQNGYYNYVLV